MLDEHAGWKFWRFDLAATLGDAPRQIEYAIDADGLDKAARCSALPLVSIAAAFLYRR